MIRQIIEYMKVMLAPNKRKLEIVIEEYTIPGTYLVVVRYGSRHKSWLLGKALRSTVPDGWIELQALDNIRELFAETINAPQNNETLPIPAQGSGQSQTVSGPRPNS